MIDETVTNPSVCLVTPADSSHKPKGMPNAKLGIAADMPKKIKLNCVFFNLSSIDQVPIKIWHRIIFTFWCKFAVPNNTHVSILVFE